MGAKPATDKVFVMDEDTEIELLKMRIMNLEDALDDVTKFEDADYWSLFKWFEYFLYFLDYRKKFKFIMKQDRPYTRVFLSFRQFVIWSARPPEGYGKDKQST